MKRTSNALSEQDYFKLFFIVLVIVVFHLGVSILYSPDFAFSLTSFLNINESFLIVVSVTAIPILIAVFYVYQSFRNYSNSILKMFGGMYDSVMVLPYINSVYLALSAIEQTPKGIMVMTDKLEILGVYLVASILASLTVKKVSFILVYVYRAKGLDEKVEEISLNEEKITLGEKEYLLIDIYTRKGNEKESQVLVGKDELWSISSERSEGLSHYILKPMSSLSDWLKIVYRKTPLIEFEIETSKILRKVKVILELLIPTQGSKNIRSYEIVKEEGTPLIEYIRELSKLIDTDLNVIKVSRKTRKGYIEVNPSNEIPASDSENRYLVEAQPVGTKKEERVMPVATPRSVKPLNRQLLNEIQTLLSRYDEMRDDLW